MANMFVNVAGLAVMVGVELATMREKLPDPRKQTQVTLGVGSGPNTGGSIPYLALWDGSATRITQYNGNKNGHLADDDAGGPNIGFSLDNYQNGRRATRPEYISITMGQNDGICLSAVMTSGSGVQYLWTGDIGYTCGAQWYPGKYTLGTSNAPIKCVWLDANHDNDIIAKALSLHMRDFNADAGLLAQYRENPARLCQNTARMTFWPNMPVNGIPKFFKPPLEYLPETNHTEIGPQVGALEKPDQGIDRKMRAYPDGTDLKGHRTSRKRGRDGKNGSRLRRKGVKNLLSDRLTVSHFVQHSARQLCDDEMSLGPDFVSKEEGLFCDMETATLWPLCSEAQAMDCFDLETQNIRTVLRKREAPTKKYTFVDEWR